MRVNLLNQPDISDGAARATYRIHHSLRSYGIDSRMLVNRASAGDWTVSAPTGAWSKIRIAGSRYAGSRMARTYKTGKHSPAIIPSDRVNALNASDADLVHLNWINGVMLSIADIGRIKKTLVWTLHDMWAFCGAEHYTDNERWQSGYTRANRPPEESGFDLNRWTSIRKQKHWQTPMSIVTPSQWLANCVKASALMQSWPVTVIPNAIDTGAWKPIEQALARELLGLQPDTPMLLCGAIGGAQDPRKGFDLLREALQHLNGQLPGLHLLVFGETAPKVAPDLGFPVHYTGRIYDDLNLRALYSAADALVIPSRQDNLPNTGLEALSCGTPVVAFDTGGLADIVDHKQTGYLACAFDTKDMAEGLAWVLDHSDSKSLHANARSKAIESFDNTVIAQRYAKLYEEVLSP